MQSSIVPQRLRMAENVISVPPLAFSGKRELPDHTDLFEVA